MLAFYIKLKGGHRIDLITVRQYRHFLERYPSLKRKSCHMFKQRAFLPDKATKQIQLSCELGTKMIATRVNEGLSKPTF